ncbi:ABC transporter ATP-binding protein [Paracoccus albus]|uniref:ABC transporter ATP-binding protein n=1 Tax=Paracoccus albus TaxID=3017784 RepID=UPI0022F00240|nr:ABC transporter ATP-binding protein [Paracoccus albus]WBU59751.1 ABC transporter ATP-binding protein [Paracoccus albus]
MLQIKNAERRFAATPAVQGLSLDVAGGGVTCLLGPSGCGKSTTLRLIAGIEKLDQGEIRIDGQVVSDASFTTPPERRPVGMVFQDLALFPHMTIAQNIAFGIPKAKRAEVQVGQLLDRVGLTGYGQKYPHMLSGGEQQRIALIRALAAQPKIMMLDEPFSSLDQRLRAEMREFTLDLLRESGTTAILVTHDPDEAMMMADRIAVMDRGRILQEGTPQNLYHRPAALPVAQLLADLNMLQGNVRDGHVETKLGMIPAHGVAEGSNITCAIRPEHLRPCRCRPQTGNAQVLRVHSLGRESVIELGLAGHAHRLRCNAPGSSDLVPGETVGLSFDPAHVMMFAENSGLRLS